MVSAFYLGARSQKNGPWHIFCRSLENGRPENTLQKDLMMMQIWLRGYHADALTYALIACIGSPSCAFSNSVALTFVNSNSATCCENEEPGFCQR